MDVERPLEEMAIDNVEEHKANDIDIDVLPQNPILRDINA